MPGLKYYRMTSMKNSIPKIHIQFLTNDVVVRLIGFVYLLWWSLHISNQQPRLSRTRFIRVYSSSLVDVSLGRRSSLDVRKDCIGLSS